MPTLLAMMMEHHNPRQFYRAVYKGTDCGPTIGMKIGDLGWLYNNDLPEISFLKLPPIHQVKISSIVEGSDVEIEGYVIEDSKNASEMFWRCLDQVNDEAKFYWKRDNSDWYLITIDGVNHTCHNTPLLTEDGFWWDYVGDETPTHRERAIIENQIALADALEFVWSPQRGIIDDQSFTFSLFGKICTVKRYINDMEY